MARVEDLGTGGPVDSGVVGMVTFYLDERRFAVPLDAVVRVERVVAITSLPQAPMIIIGIVDLHGQVLPVADIRRRFGMSSRPIELTDQLLFLKTRERSVAFLVDAVGGVGEASADCLVGMKTVFPGLEYIRGILQLEDGMVLIHDPESFLSLEEERMLDKALQGAQPQPDCTIK
ncbi:MAG: chemotaxis protein CheW [Syntrophales bacterium]|nr:chemotaxis protein CheW [Syntrophales bacterium]